ncbi:hypothetical protein K1719_023932 [Acacia pycnantha]|nr:hypothetical protein K1719_023932 [Acacia pycnantha]
MNLFGSSSPSPTIVPFCCRPPSYPSAVAHCRPLHSRLTPYRSTPSFREESLSLCEIVGNKKYHLVTFHFGTPAKKLHPDTNKDDPEAGKKFKKFRWHMRCVIRIKKTTVMLHTLMGPYCIGTGVPGIAGLHSTGTGIVGYLTLGACVAMIHVFQVAAVDIPGNYLGLPTIWRRSKIQALNFVVDKVKKRVQR